MPVRGERAVVLGSEHERGRLSNSNDLSSAVVTSLIAAGRVWPRGVRGSDRRGGGLVGVPAAQSDLRVLGAWCLSGLR